MNTFSFILVINVIFFISFFLLKNIYISLFLSLLILFILLFVSKKKTIPSLSVSLNLPNFTFDNNQYIYTIICLIIFLVLEKFIGFNGSLFATFFIFAYLNKLNSRASFFIALILLIITALLSIGGRIIIAEEMAIMVYYFLVVGVVWMTIEIRRDKSQDIEAIEQKLEEVIIKNNMSEPNSSNFLTKKNVVLIGVSISLSLIIFLFYSLYTKPRLVKEPAIISPISSIITPTSKIFKNAPFNILNATNIRGYAASAAAILRTSGWNKEFDISVGNYDGTVSSNILRHTKNLTEKIKPLERDLKIQITPIIFNQASREAEMTLILGD